jgi:hypothetical protein
LNPFLAILRPTIDRLSEDSAEARAAIYDRGRREVQDNAAGFEFPETLSDSAVSIGWLSYNPIRPQHLCIVQILRKPSCHDRI